MNRYQCLFNRPGTVSDLGNGSCFETNNCPCPPVPPCPPPFPPIPPIPPRPPISPTPIMPTISVGSTTTGAPGTAAYVVNSGTPTNVVLDFVIPQGPMGPTGPTGSTQTTAYGGIYNNTATTTSLSANTPATVSMPLVMPANNTTLSSTGITVNTPGVYKIEYSYTGNPSIATNLSAFVADNGTAIPGGTTTVTAQADVQTNADGTVLATLNAGDVISLNVVSSVDSAITQGTGTNSYLIVNKIN